MKIKNLEKFFLNNTIPEIKEKPLTFLAIAKQPHYENVWSNIYAFYFNVKGEHGLKDLFTKSLLKLINENTDCRFKFTNKFEIQTEFGTDKGGRIDLLLSNYNDAIIIENKVKHTLNNNLKDYWSSITVSNKVGIVLSLNKIKNISKPFINITHLELLSEVMQDIENYIVGASDKYTVFLKDFYQNIINLSNPMEEKLLDFYYSYSEQIINAINIQDSIKDYVLNEVETACSLIPGIEFYKYGQNRQQGYDYFLSQFSENLVYTIDYDELLLGKNKLTIIVELHDELFEQNVKKLSKLKLSKKEEELRNSDFAASKHFAIKEINVERKDFINLSYFISEAIVKSPLASIFRKVEKCLFLKK